MEGNKNPVNMNPSGKIQGLGAIGYNIELRDLFAMAAMQGMLSNYHISSVRDLEVVEKISNKAYAIADEMLKARRPEDDRMPGDIPPSV